MTEADFQYQAAALAKANGLSRELAAEYLGRIGDTPELDGDGRAVVRDEEGREIARVILPRE